MSHYPFRLPGRLNLVVPPDGEPSGAAPADDAPVAVPLEPSRADAQAAPTSPFPSPLPAFRLSPWPLPSNGGESVSMETLWAPWRLGYIVGEDKPPERSRRPICCPVPRRIASSASAAPAGDDRPRLVVARDERTITVLNRYPYNNGHLLVAPRRHLGRLDELVGRRAACPCAVRDAHGLGAGEGAAARGVQRGLNLGRVAGPACRGTCTGTSSPAGPATRTSCPCWPASASSRNRSTRCGSWCGRSWQSDA